VGGTFGPAGTAVIESLDQGGALEGFGPRRTNDGGRWDKAIGAWQKSPAAILRGGAIRTLRGRARLSTMCRERVHANDPLQRSRLV